MPAAVDAALRILPELLMPPAKVDAPGTKIPPPLAEIVPELLIPPTTDEALT